MFVMLAGLTRLTREQRNVHVSHVSMANVNMGSSRLLVTICINCSNVQEKIIFLKFCAEAVCDYFR